MSAEGEPPATSRRPVVIEYHRPPDRTRDFHQELVLERDDVLVTLAREMSWPEPLVIDGEVALEEGSSVVWFTFPGRWHDIGRFHRADGRLTGIYANVLTPVELHPRPAGWREGRTGDAWRWSTTDLFLDLWMPARAAARAPRILDEEELADAEARRWVEEGTAERARAEARRLLHAAEAGDWPPPVVEEWTLERAVRSP